MLSGSEFIKQSLTLHLFFARNMMEHSFFLAANFPAKDSMLAQQANNFKMHFARLLADTVSLSNGVVSSDVLNSGEVISQYTLHAEMATQYFTGVPFETNITQAEAALAGNGVIMPNPMLEQSVYMLNQRAIVLITALAQFKSTLLSQVLSCRIFTNNYPLLIDHIVREATFYLMMVQRLQKREETDSDKHAMEQEAFWSNIMGEHAKFIRGLLDPTEDELFQAANNFGNEFDTLTAASKAAIDATMPVKKVTDDNLKATQRIRDFKAQGTNGILECNVKSIIIPLLADHTLREANHYLRLLKKYSK